MSHNFVGHRKWCIYLLHEVITVRAGRVRSCHVGVYGRNLYNDVYICDHFPYTSGSLMHFQKTRINRRHNNDIIMSAMASQITSLMIVYSRVYSGADHRKHQSSASLAFMRGIHRRPGNSPHKGPVTRKMFPFDYVIMSWQTLNTNDKIPITTANVFNQPLNITWFLMPSQLFPSCTDNLSSEIY